MFMLLLKALEKLVPNVTIMCDKRVFIVSVISSETGSGSTKLESVEELICWCFKESCAWWILMSFYAFI